MLLTCERITTTLSMIVGFAEKKDNMEETRNLVDEIYRQKQENEVRALNFMINGIRKITDEASGVL